MKYKKSLAEVNSDFAKLKKSKLITDQAEYYFKKGSIYYTGAYFKWHQKKDKQGFIWEYYSEKIPASEERSLIEFQMAADLNHSEAQCFYAMHLEKGKFIKQNKSEAYLYYCKSAIQEQKDSLKKICENDPILFNSLNQLKETLRSRGQLIGSKLSIDNKDGMLDESKRKDIDETVASFKALIDIYQYFDKKKDSDFQQREKRADFSYMLKLIQTTRTEDLPILIDKYEENTRNNFVARTHFIFFTGSQEYYNIRKSCLNVLKTIDPSNAKAAVSAIINVIQKDNLAQKNIAQEIMAAERLKENQSGKAVMMTSL